MKNYNSLEHDYLYCEAMIKRHSKSFYYAFNQLPREKAKAVFAIYAFCRRADDSVDSSSTFWEKKQKLDWLEHELTLFSMNKELNHPIWRALADVFARYDMEIQPFFDQMKGQRMDISFQIPKTMEELETYSYFVAGSVGLMLLPILASETKKDLSKEVINLGIAMQITNILRDVGEDYEKNNRIYLPSSLMMQEDYREKDLRNCTVNQGFIQIWEQMARRAEQLYDEFQYGIKHFDQDSQFQVLLSARIYRGILNAVRENNYDCLTKKNAVQPWEMVQIQTTTRASMV